MKSIKLLISIGVVFVCTAVRANNITLTNISSVSGSGYVQLQFDLSWENSWNTNSTNYDAAWIFFKFKDNDGTWRHLNLTNANNTVTGGYAITVPADKTGAFIYRSASGSGTVTLTGVQLGVNNLPGSFDVKGFAIEMVRIPSADTYYVGDGTVSIVYYQAGAASGTAFLVNSNSITMGTTAGQLNDGMGGNGNTLAASFPIGYNSSPFTLYMMKHEITQGAYRDFLNTLTYTQQVSRTQAAPNSAAGTFAVSGVGLSTRRNGLKIATAGVASATPAVYGCDLNGTGGYNETTDGEWIPEGYLIWPDVAAFLDWAALRPMTELEYEKSCRGPNAAVLNEVASGTAAINTNLLTLNNSGASNEVVASYPGSIYNSNINYQNSSNGGSGNPMRVGIHATAYATRISSGAGYYGCLDLSGNAVEMTVHTGNVAGRSFTGLSGDGTLTTAGDANTDFWPGINGNTIVISANTAFGGATGVTGSAGVIHRGGTGGSAALNIIVSFRGTVGSVGGTRGNSQAQEGGRGVKSF